MIRWKNIIKQAQKKRKHVEIEVENQKDALLAAKMGCINNYA